MGGVLPVGHQFTTETVTVNDSQTGKAAVCVQLVFPHKQTGAVFMIRSDRLPAGQEHFACWDEFKGC